jgi:hypothetical protein
VCQLRVRMLGFVLVASSISCAFLM